MPGKPAVLAHILGARPEDTPAPGGSVDLLEMDHWIQKSDGTEIAGTRKTVYSANRTFRAVWITRDDEADQRLCIELPAGYRLTDITGLTSAYSDVDKFAVDAGNKRLYVGTDVIAGAQYSTGYLIFVEEE